MPAGSGGAGLGAKGLPSSSSSCFAGFGFGGRLLGWILLRSVLLWWGGSGRLSLDPGEAATGKNCGQ